MPGPDSVMPALSVADLPVGRGPGKVVGSDDLAATGATSGADMVGYDDARVAPPFGVSTVQEALDAIKAGGGGGETLQQTLALGNFTGGTSMVVSDGDTIQGEAAGAGSGLDGKALVVEGGAGDGAGRRGPVVLRVGANGSVQADTGGNARGFLAIDFQSTRSVATQVASGLRAAVLNGRDNTASGEDAVAEGRGNSATGFQSHAEGRQTTAGDYCHTEGFNTSATYVGHAEGGTTAANGDYAHAEGFLTTATGNFSHAEGINTTSTGVSSHAEGEGTIALGNTSHAEGNFCAANGQFSHAEGTMTGASGEASHAEGTGTIANADFSHAEGRNSIVGGLGTAAHVEGDGTGASGVGSHAEGALSQAAGAASHAEGTSTITTGDSAHAQGISSRADGRAADASGQRANASRLGQVAQSSGRPNTAGTATGQAQGSWFSPCAMTTDAVATELLLGEAPTTDRMILRLSTTWTVSGLITGRRTAGLGTIGDSSGWKFECVIKQDGATNTVLVAAATITLIAQDAGAAPWVVAVVADDVNEALQINVTGEAGETVVWEAHVWAAEVGLGA